MTVDINNWRRIVRDAADSLADEAMQRRAWFGLGPEVDDPGEAFCHFFDDAAVEEFLERKDHGLTDKQFLALEHLTKLMRKLSDETPKFIDPHDLIDDPRWIEIRKAAAEFVRALDK